MRATIVPIQLATIKRRKPGGRGGSTQSQLAELRRELKRVRSVVAGTADTLELIKRDCAANLRRCGELQIEIDTLRKIQPPALVR